MSDRRSLLERVKARLAELTGLEVTPITLNGASETDLGVDAVVSLKAPDGGVSSGPILIDVQAGPLTADRIREVERQQRYVDALRGGAKMLIAAEWISPQATTRLRDARVGYVDMQGNAFLRMDQPLIILRTDGSRRSPSGLRQAGTDDRTLAGPKALRLVRALIDVRPPYRAVQLAEVTRLSAPYVSRLLSAAGDRGFVTTTSRAITDVDWEGLLRYRADLTPLLTPGRYSSYVAATASHDDVLARLRDVDRPVAVTGHAAAREFVPVALGGQLMIYVSPAPGDERPEQARDAVARVLRLLPKDGPGGVLLLSAADEAPLFARSRDGVPRVALSQLALDCLSGPGRLPAEGEALVGLLRASEDWRPDTLQAWAKRAWGE